MMREKGSERLARRRGSNNTSINDSSQNNFQTIDEVASEASNSMFIPRSSVAPRNSLHHELQEAMRNTENSFIPNNQFPVLVIKKKRERDSLESLNPASLKRPTTQETRKRLSQALTNRHNDSLARKTASSARRVSFGGDTSEQAMDVSQQNEQFSFLARNRLPNLNNNNMFSHGNNLLLINPELLTNRRTPNKSRNRSHVNSSSDESGSQTFNESKEQRSFLENLRRQSDLPAVNPNELHYKHFNDPDMSYVSVSHPRSGFQTMVDKPKAFLQELRERRGQVRKNERFTTNRPFLREFTTLRGDDGSGGSSSSSKFSPKKNRSGIVRYSPSKPQPLSFRDGWRSYKTYRLKGLKN